MKEIRFWFYKIYEALKILLHPNWNLYSCTMMSKLRSCLEKKFLHQNSTAQNSKHLPTERWQINKIKMQVKMHMVIVQIHFQRFKTGFDYFYQARVGVKVWTEEDYMIICIWILNAKQITPPTQTICLRTGGGGAADDAEKHEMVLW